MYGIVLYVQLYHYRYCLFIIFFILLFILVPHPLRSKHAWTCLFLGVFVGVGTGTLALVAPPFHFSYFWFGVFGANLLGRTHMS
mgnify:CR=1 FL=1